MTTLAQQFNAEWVPIIAERAKSRGINPEFALAQIIQESYYGTRSPKGSNNYAGIHDFRKNSNGVYASDNGNRRKFRVFGSKEEFADHYLDMLVRLYPKVVGAKTIGEYASALQDGPRKYAESPKYKQHLAEVWSANYGNGQLPAGDYSTIRDVSASNGNVYGASMGTGTVSANFGTPQQKPPADPYEDLWKMNHQYVKPAPEERTKLTAGNRSPFKVREIKDVWGIK